MEGGRRVISGRFAALTGSLHPNRPPGREVLQTADLAVDKGDELVSPVTCDAWCVRLSRKVWMEALERKDLNPSSALLHRDVARSLNLQVANAALGHGSLAPR